MEGGWYLNISNYVVCVSPSEGVVCVIIKSISENLARYSSAEEACQVLHHGAVK